MKFIFTTLRNLSSQLVVAVEPLRSVGDLIDDVVLTHFVLTNVPDSGKFIFSDGCELISSLWTYFSTVLEKFIFSNDFENFCLLKCELTFSQILPNSTDQLGLTRTVDGLSHQMLTDKRLTVDCLQLAWNWPC